jgi:predicted unusual protein kinase regulating ubiquinone biosynthesis (AarF/ABC1/UbiB family)
MEALGPTYIKLGQVLSVRPDILPQAALNELQILQDSVAPFRSEEAVALIEAELGGPVEKYFSDLSAEPVAAASLAQVYKAKLAFGPNSGTTVAVKV